MEITKDELNISLVIRSWVRVTQYAMLDAIRYSEAWRESIPLIAGSAASGGIERARVERIMAWMWDALGDIAVLAAVPADARQAWNHMLVERTSEAARYAHYACAGANLDAVYAAAEAARYAAYAAAEAAYTPAGANPYADYAAYAAEAVRAVRATDAARADYWDRRDPAGLLAELVALR